jgi:hypothetical protein
MLLPEPGLAIFRRHAAGWGDALASQVSLTPLLAHHVDPAMIGVAAIEG